MNTPVKIGYYDWKELLRNARESNPEISSKQEIEEIALERIPAWSTIETVEGTFMKLPNLSIEGEYAYLSAFRGYGYQCSDDLHGRNDRGSSYSGAHDSVKFLKSIELDVINHDHETLEDFYKDFLINSSMYSMLYAVREYDVETFCHLWALLNSQYALNPKERVILSNLVDVCLADLPDLEQVDFQGLMTPAIIAPINIPLTVFSEKVDGNAEISLSTLTNINDMVEVDYLSYCGVYHLDQIYNFHLLGEYLHLNYYLELDSNCQSVIKRASLDMIIKYLRFIYGVDYDGLTKYDWDTMLEGRVPRRNR